MCWWPSAGCACLQSRLIAHTWRQRRNDDDCCYYHSWRNNVVLAFGTLSSPGNPGGMCQAWPRHRSRSSRDDCSRASRSQTPVRPRQLRLLPSMANQLCLTRPPRLRITVVRAEPGSHAQGRELLAHAVTTTYFYAPQHLARCRSARAADSIRV